MGKLMLYIASCMITSIGTIALLSGLSRDIRKRPGSFLREYPPHPIVDPEFMRVADNSYYIAGIANDKIYLSSPLSPLYLLEIDQNMTDTSLVKLNIDGIESERYFRITVRIDSPYFYLMDGVIPYIYRGKIGDWTGELFIHDTYFVDAIPLSARAFAIRALSSRTKEHALGKLTTNPRDIFLNYDLLEKQYDGIFCTDGSISFDRLSGTLTYVYYYRNQFIIMDSSVNLVSRGNTIDTFRTAPIRTTYIGSEGATELSVPPRIINRSHDIYKDWLFINSVLPAKNESMEHFNEASVIDVYDVASQEYKFSFYIFDDEGERMKQFRVVNNRIFVLYDRAIWRYDLNEAYFSESAKQKITRVNQE